MFTQFLEGTQPSKPKPSLKKQPSATGVKNPNFNMELGKPLTTDTDGGDIYHAKHDDNVLIKAPKSIADPSYDQPAVGDQEINNLKHLKDNPHAMNIVNHKKVDGYEHLAMEKVKGKDVTDLSQMSRDENRIPAKVWQAVSSIHKDGIAHRDLHGANMKYDEDEDIVKMIDFGESNKSYKSSYEEALKGLMGNGKHQGAKGFEQEFHLNRKDLNKLEKAMRSVMMMNKEGIDRDISDTDNEEAYQGYVNRLYDGLDDIIDNADDYYDDDQSFADFMKQFTLDD